MTYDFMMRTTIICIFGVYYSTSCCDFTTFVAVVFMIRSDFFVFRSIAMNALHYYNTVLVIFVLGTFKMHAILITFYLSVIFVDENFDSTCIYISRYILLPVFFEVAKYCSLFKDSHCI